MRVTTSTTRRTFVLCTKVRRAVGAVARLFEQILLGEFGQLLDPCGALERYRVIGLSMRHASAEAGTKRCRCWLTDSRSSEQRETQERRKERNEGEAQPLGLAAPAVGTEDEEKEEGNLVDSASSHTLVSKIKPCMSKYKRPIQ